MRSIKIGYGDYARSDDRRMAACARLQAGIFTMSAETIAESLASREHSPQGPSSGLRLLTFYINYAGKRLSASRRKNLEKARKLLSERVTRELAKREQRAAA